MSANDTLDALYTYIAQRLRSHDGDTEDFRQSVINMTATLSTVGKEALRSRITNACLASGLLTSPAETFTTELQSTIEGVLNGH